MTRTRPAHALFAGALLVWTSWALHVCRGAVPGLLDDGSHLIHSDQYRTGGFFATVGHDLGGLGKHARFYEIQYGLLGLYNIAFGHDLAKWYLANFALGLATGLLIYAVVRLTTGSSAGATLGSLVFLTGSPLAEATRANFGKAEVVMTFLFMSGIALLVTAASWPAAPATHRRPVYPIMALAIGAVLLAAAAKESGRLFGLALVVAAVVGVRSRPSSEGQRFWLGSLAALGVAAGVVNILIFWPSHANAYLRSYFSLDLSAAHLWRAGAFYATQNGDVILIALATLPLVSAALGRGARAREGGPRRAELFVALYLVAIVYSGALLALRFQLSYYLYVPAALLSLVLGWTAASASARTRRALTALAVVTRLYSVPYNVVIAEAQAAFDQVNYQAMERVRDLSPPRVIALDLDESSQFVQEWNLLRWFSFDGALAPLFGAAPYFESWLYQDDLRALDRVSYDPTATYGNLSPARVRAAGDIDPAPGDVVAVRSGTMRRFHCFLRGVMPQHFDREFSLGSVDPAALEWVGTVSAPTAAVRFVGGSFAYQWDFFRLIAPPRYLLLGRDADGWMRPEAGIRFAPQPARNLILTVEVPGWLPFSYPLHLSATRGEGRIAVLDVHAAGTHQWTIPAGAPGALSLRSEQWFQPSALGVSPDARMMSYRVIAVSLASDSTGPFP